ncbi:hypothetical protein G9A89_020253 [Geosiphon pyriformis]|nr:hypothetical protein G9A89_020253 [Geosiphon pyriformis]
MESVYNVQHHDETYDVKLLPISQVALNNSEKRVVLDTIHKDAVAFHSYKTASTLHPNSNSLTATNLPIPPASLSSPELQSPKRSCFSQPASIIRNFFTGSLKFNKHQSNATPSQKDKTSLPKFDKRASLASSILTSNTSRMSSHSLSEKPEERTVYLNKGTVTVHKSLRKKSSTTFLKVKTLKKSKSRDQVNTKETRNPIGKLYRRATAPNLKAKAQAQAQAQAEADDGDGDVDADIEQDKHNEKFIAIYRLKNIVSKTTNFAPAATPEEPVVHRRERTRFTLDDVINPEKLSAHLEVLKKFQSLEHSDSHIDLRYLLRAQERYFLWLDLLDKGNFSSPPVPPLDVSYIWHAHCLSPIRYYEDTRRLHLNRALNYNFPLRKLSELWKRSSEHMHERSKQIWEKQTGKPWFLDPFDNSDFEVDCPWCAMPLQLTSQNYVNLMRTPEHHEKCLQCGAFLSIDSMSAKRFLDDVADWMISKGMDEGKNPTTRKPYIGGTLVDVKSGEADTKASKSDCEYLFDVRSAHIVDMVAVQRLKSSQCQWPNIIKAIQFRMGELKRQWKLSNLRKGVVKRLVSSYAGLTSPFSIDLVSAVLRQREFTHKMVGNQAIYHADSLNQAVARYQRFLRLMRRKPNACLVPTLDIDLCWHTHLLHPRPYRKFMKTHLKRVVNHDDTIPQSTLEGAFAKTSKIWHKKYKEPYSNENTKKNWLIPSRKMIAAVVPPYAAFLIWKLKKQKRPADAEPNDRQQSYLVPPLKGSISLDDLKYEQNLEEAGQQAKNKNFLGKSHAKSKSYDASALKPFTTPAKFECAISTHPSSSAGIFFGSQVSTYSHVAGSLSCGGGCGQGGCTATTAEQDAFDSIGQCGASNCILEL